VNSTNRLLNLFAKPLMDFGRNLYFITGSSSASASSTTEGLSMDSLSPVVDSSEELSSEERDFSMDSFVDPSEELDSLS